MTQGALPKARGNGGYIQRVDESVNVATSGRLLFVPPITIPFTTFNSAYQALDTFGAPFTIPVPQFGAIVDLTFHDLAYQNIGKELWISRVPFPAFTVDNAAFSLVDADSLQYMNPITIAVFKDAVNNSKGVSGDLPYWYYAPLGELYCIFKTLGADTIASAAVAPLLSLTIESYMGPSL